jgi:hypothetical protein
MKTKILIGLLFLVLNNSYGQDTLYSIAYTGPCPTGTAFCTYDLNDRDTSNYFFIDTTQPNNIWVIGTPAKSVFNSAYSPPLALVSDTLNPYPINNVSSFSFTIATDDLTYIHFWHRINTDSLTDGGVIEYSTDGGANWNNIINSSYILSNFYSNTSTISSNGNRAGFTGTTGWIESVIQGYALYFVKFRFTFTSDNLDTNKDGWMIDDIEVNCIGTGINEIANSPFQIYPNPTSDFISIFSSNEVKLIEVAIIDITGKIVLTTSHTIVDLSKLEAGIYFIDLITDTGKYLSRIVRK